MKHLVDICRIGYGHTTIEIEGAKDSAEAERMAMDQAGDHTYSEKEADYEVQSVVPEDRQPKEPEPKEKQAIIISGNIFDGMRVYGPFPNASFANEWADDALQGEEWWGKELEDPGCTFETE